MTPFALGFICVLLIGIVIQLHRILTILFHIGILIAHHLDNGKEK